MKVVELDWRYDDDDDTHATIDCPFCGGALLDDSESGRRWGTCGCTKFVWSQDNIEYIEPDTWDKESFVRSYQAVRAESLESESCLEDGDYLGSVDLEIMKTVKSKAIDCVATFTESGLACCNVELTTLWGLKQKG